MQFERDADGTAQIPRTVTYDGKFHLAPGRAICPDTHGPVCEYRNPSRTDSLWMRSDGQVLLESVHVDRPSAFIEAGSKAQIDLLHWIRRLGELVNATHKADAAPSADEAQAVLQGIRKAADRLALGLQISGLEIA